MYIKEGCENGHIPITARHQGCAIDFLFQFGFGSVFCKKNSGSVQNEFGSVRFENAVRFGC